MSLTPKGAGLASDYDESSDTYLEIDDISFDAGDEGAPKKPKDKFMIKVDSLETREKRRAGTIQKRMRSEDGETNSKYVDDNFVSGYALYDLVTPPYDLEALAKIFEENSTHNAAVAAKANNCVGLGYSWSHTRKAKSALEEKDSEKRRKYAEKLNREMERLDEILEGFHEEETFSESVTKAMTDMYALGNGYLEIGRKSNGEIGYVGHIPATQIRIRRKRDGFVQLVVNHSKTQAVFFRNFGDKETPDPINKDPEPNEIVHFKTYSPSNTYYGVPTIVSALSAIVGDKFAKEYNIDYFENKAIPRYAIVIKGAKLSDKAKQELVKYFRNEVKGKNHGTLVIPLPATMGNTVDIKFEKLEASVQDSSFEKYRKSNRDEVITAHRIPPTKVAVYENANLAVSRDADKTFKEQVMAPDQERVEKRINRIVKEFTDLLVLKFIQLDIIDADMKSRIFDRYLRTEVLDPNEVRDEIGLPAREGGGEVLPYPTRVQQEKNEMDVEQKEKDRKEQVKMRTSGGTVGAPTGNSNNPSRSGPETPKDQNGTNAERGQRQDEGAGRDRS